MFDFRGSALRKVHSLTHRWKSFQLFREKLSLENNAVPDRFDPGTEWCFFQERVYVYPQEIYGLTGLETTSVLEELQHLLSETCEFQMPTVRCTKFTFSKPSFLRNIYSSHSETVFCTHNWWFLRRKKSKWIEAFAWNSRGELASTFFLKLTHWGAWPNVSIKDIVEKRRIPPDFIHLDEFVMCESRWKWDAATLHCICICHRYSVKCRSLYQAWSRIWSMGHIMGISRHVTWAYSCIFHLAFYVGFDQSLPQRLRNL